MGKWTSWHLFWSGGLTALDDKKNLAGELGDEAQLISASVGDNALMVFFGS